MKQVYDISKGQASCIQKKISDWTINGGGLVLNLGQGTIAGLKIPSAEIIFFIEFVFQNIRFNYKTYPSSQQSVEVRPGISINIFQNKNFRLTSSA